MAAPGAGRSLRARCRQMAAPDLASQWFEDMCDEAVLTHLGDRFVEFDDEITVRFEGFGCVEAEARLVLYQLGEFVRQSVGVGEPLLVDFDHRSAKPEPPAVLQVLDGEFHVADDDRAVSCCLVLRTGLQC